LSSDSDNETSKRLKKLPLRFQSSSSDDENHPPGKQHVESKKRTKHPILPPFPEISKGKNIFDHKTKMSFKKFINN